MLSGAVFFDPATGATGFMTVRTIAIAVSLLMASISQAQIRITEWEYNGLSGADAGEFVELMNIGASPIDMTGWSFDDASGVAGSFAIGGFGVVQPKEIVIIAERAADVFRTAWNLPASIKVIGLNNQNLSRNDGIHIFNNTNTLVDKLLFGDEDFPGSIRTQGFTGNPQDIAALGAQNVALWKKSALGDVYGSFTSAENNVGNPGKFLLIPEPGTLLLLLIAAFGLAALRHR